MNSPESMTPAVLTIRTPAGNILIAIYDTGDAAKLPPEDRPHAGSTECGTKLCVVTLPRTWADALPFPLPRSGETGSP
jgi:hypothetical protein